HSSSIFFFTTSLPSHIYTLSLHDALPILTMALSICQRPVLSTGKSMTHVSTVFPVPALSRSAVMDVYQVTTGCTYDLLRTKGWRDRKSTRLNSSHVAISYAVFCLKKKKKK